MFRNMCIVVCVLMIQAGCVIDGHANPAPDADDVLAAMRKAASFMDREVSTNGGYVFMCRDDLGERWGEIPARDTQIWVQPPGTPAVGAMYLDVYRATGDAFYLGLAERAASALVWGQLPSGGWHYLIDFDMPGLEKWYDEVASKCWGWEEYIHYYGNCTFDDEATSAPTMFLMNLYLETLDPRWREPLIRALGCILDAQYPSGGWPQRWPVKREFVHGGHPDYTGHYTFNDGVMTNNIDVLVAAWERLGDERYLGAARRAMDFYLAAQLPEPQAGWADQYDMDMRPAQARMFEPPAVGTIQTVNCIRDLMRFYRFSGDRRYLVPIPSALEWLEDSRINTDPDRTYRMPFFGDTPRKYTHAYYYEPGTNRPIYSHRSGTGLHDEKFWISYDFTDMYPYGPPFVLDLAPIRDEYERVASLSPDEARAEYRRDGDMGGGNGHTVSAADVRAVIDSLDDRGAWVTDTMLVQYLNDAVGSPRVPARVIDVRVFSRNMRLLADYYRGVHGEE